MSHTNGFLHEMVKQAGLGGFMKNLMKNREAGKIGLGKALAIGGLGGGGAYMAGKSKGEGEGLEEGMQNMNAGMQRAYSMGVQRGAQYVMSRLQQGQE